MKMPKHEAQAVWNMLSGAEKDVLIQLRTVTWDGNLISKQGRTDLVRKDLAIQYEGFQVISMQGLNVLEALGRLRDLTK